MNEERELLELAAKAAGLIVADEHTHAPSAGIWVEGLGPHCGADKCCMCDMGDDVRCMSCENES